MPVNKSHFGKALWPGVKKWYGEVYNQHSPEYSQIFETMKSEKNREELMGFSGLGLAQASSDGQPVTYDTFQQGFKTDVKHITYKLGFVITKEMVEDDQYGIVARQRAQSLARSMIQTKETVGANILNRAFNSSYTYGDGKELCATDHPNVAGGTWANELTTAADFSEASIEQACIDIGKWTDDRGLKINVMPRKLIIPVDLQFEVDRVLNSSLRAGTADNDKNVLSGKFPGGVHMNHYLTDTDAWFILTDVQGSGSGLIHFERVGDSFGEDNDFDTDNAKFKARARYSFTAGDPRAIFGSPGAA